MAPGQVCSAEQPPSRSGRLSGWVLDEANRPLEEAQIIIASGPSHPDIAALTGADGHFAFVPLAPGRYLLRVAASGFAPRRVDVVVRAGLRAEITVRLDRARRPSRPPGRWEAPESPADEDTDEEPD